MLRAVCCVVALSACGPRGTAPTEPRPAGPDPIGPVDAAVPSTTADGPIATGTGSAAPITTGSPADGPPQGSAAYCLFVGEEKLVVRCYWTRPACVEQAAFNKDSGSLKSQECRGVPQAYCYTSENSERCYPSSDDCARNVENMRKRSRPASDCVTKTAP